MNHIAILHDVVLAFQPEFTLLAASSFAAELRQVFESNNLGPYETALDVRVNHAGSLVGVRTALDRPRAAFVFSGGQKTYQVEQRVTSANESVARGLDNAKVLQKFALLLRFKLRDFHLDLPRHRDNLEPL